MRKGNWNNRRTEKGGRGHGRRRRNPLFMGNNLLVNDPWKDYVKNQHNLGEGLKTIWLDHLFRKEINNVGPISHLNAGIMPADLALLRGMTSLYKDCSYFEIARCRSESIANIATLATLCYSLNPPVGEMRRSGVRNRYMFMMGSYSMLPDNVVMLSGDSRIFNYAGIGRKFDIIFINNGHGYERVLNDTQKAFEYLAHKESAIVWHDYCFFPQQIQYEVLAGILDGTDPADREQLFFVPKTKCAIFLSENQRAKIQSK